MKKLFALLAMMAAVACGAPASDLETVDSTQQAARTGYIVSGIRVARSASALFEDNWGSGALAAHMNKIAYSTLAVSVIYRPVAVLANPASICNGNYAHDSLAVLGYGISKMAVFDRATTRAFFLVSQRNAQSDIPECNVVNPNTASGITLSDAFRAQYPGLQTDAQAIIGATFTHDDSCDANGCDAFSITHELMHGQPTFLSSENDNSHPGGASFGHDGVISCTGNASPYKWRLSNSSCVANSTGAPESFLDYLPDPTFPPTHQAAYDETAEVKYQSHWFAHVSRAESTLVYNAPVDGAVPIGPLKLSAHDLGTISPDGYYEIRMPRPDGAVVYLEYRANYYGTCPNLDCPWPQVDNPSAVNNAPGVYAWVVMPVSAGGGIYQLQMCGPGYPSPFFYKGICPLSGGLNTIEGTLRINVTYGTNSAQVTINFI